MYKQAFVPLVIPIPHMKGVHQSRFNEPITSPLAYALGINREGPTQDDVLIGSAKHINPELKERSRSLSKHRILGMLAGAGGGALLGAGLGHTLGSDTDYVNQAQTVFGGALGTTLGGVIGHTAGGFIGAKKYNKHIADHGTLDHKPITKTDKKHIDASNHMSNHIATGASLGSLSGVALRLLSGAGVLGDDMKHMANDTPSFAYGGTGALLGGGVGAITGKMTSRK